MKDDVFRANFDHGDLRSLNAFEETEKNVSVLSINPTSIDTEEFEMEIFINFNWNLPEEISESFYDSLKTIIEDFWDVNYTGNIFLTIEDVKNLNEGITLVVNISELINVDVNTLKHEFEGNEKLFTKICEKLREF